MSNEVIRMTYRPNVAINPDNWPIIAEIDEIDDYQIKRGSMTVRQHRDGRVLVYGNHAKSNDSEMRYAGVLIDSLNAIIETIHTVSGILFLNHLACDLIDNLPVEELG